MVARVESVDDKARIVQLSLAYLDEDVKDANAGTIQEKLLASFQENEQMKSFMKSMSIVHKYDYGEIWTRFVHPIDRHRREYNQEENEDDDVSAERIRVLQTNLEVLLIFFYFLYLNSI